MSIFAVVIVALLAGLGILALPSFLTFFTVEIFASAAIAILDVLSGDTFGFVIESVVIFILCSTIIFFVLAICGAMIAYGRISNRRTNEDGAHDSRLSIARLISAGMVSLITRS